MQLVVGEAYIRCLLVLWFSLWYSSSFCFFQSDICTSINTSFNLPDIFHICIYNFFINKLMWLCSHIFDNCHYILLLFCQHYHFFLDSALDKLMPYFFYRATVKVEAVSSFPLNSLVFSRSLTRAFDLATSEAIFNLCACCSKAYLFSIHSASAINSAILIFSSSALSSLEDFWLQFVDLLLLDLDEYLLIHLTHDALLPTDTFGSLELTAAYLSALAYFIKLGIFCLNAHRLCSTSNHSLTVSCASGSALSCIPYALQTLF